MLSFCLFFPFIPLLPHSSLFRKKTLQIKFNLLCSHYPLPPVTTITGFVQIQAISSITASHCIYIHICLYICVYIYVCRYIYLQTYICAYIYTHILYFVDLHKWYKMVYIVKFSFSFNMSPIFLSRNQMVF
jgi:hypothetical protein